MLVGIEEKEYVEKKKKSKLAKVVSHEWEQPIRNKIADFEERPGRRRRLPAVHELPGARDEGEVQDGDGCAARLGADEQEQDCGHRGLDLSEAAAETISAPINRIKLVA